MEENRNNQSPESREGGYEPRPAWQVWAARAGLVIAVLFVIAQVITIIRGGM